MKLHGYFRSSATYRVRIALALKGLDWNAIPVHLLRDGGEQHNPAYLDLNPQGLVPTLELDDTSIPQSMAIIEYLDERFPDPHLLPASPEERARVRALAQMVACDIHPLCNLRVLQFLTGPLEHSECEKLDWIRHWVGSGLAAVESWLTRDGASGVYCHGDEVSLADLVLIPQVFNAKRFDCPMENLPRILSIYDACMTLPAFVRAAPDSQQDAQ